MSPAKLEMVVRFRYPRRRFWLLARAAYPMALVIGVDRTIRLGNWVMRHTAWKYRIGDESWRDGGTFDGHVELHRTEKEVAA